MRTTAQGPKAYSFAIVSAGNSSRAVVRFTCVDCSHELELANNDPRHKHGAFFAQQARRRGWDTDGVAMHKVFCPDCRKTPANRSRKQIELDSVVMPALEPPIIDGVAEPWVEGFPPDVLRVVEDVVAELATEIDETLAEQRARESTQEQPMREVKLSSRELTNEQRRQIRIMLDQYFDDKEGCYLPKENGEPMSDQSIGSIAGVPWGEVTKIRELSYGKIMVDPAIAALRTQMAELERDVATTRAAMEESMRGYVALTDQRLNEMRLALDGYGRKVAKAG